LFAFQIGRLRVTARAVIEMKKLPRFLIALSLGAAAALSAQTTTTTTTDGPRGSPRGPHGPGRGGFGHPIVRVLDTDKNGELSTAELDNAPAAIRALDANADGVVTMDELRPVRPAGAPERPADAPERPAGGPARKARGDGTASAQHIDPVMLALDANKDGALSATETANATASLKALDANSDGKLTRDELRPLPPVEN
jgi:Ca2+-binding EF-hand superfamily protein